MGRGRGAFKRDKRDEHKRTDGGYVSAEELRTLENVKFTKLYRGSIVPEAEWEACLNSFRTCLPTCFRINTALSQAVPLRDFVERELNGFTEIRFVPGRMAFQTAVSRGEIKRDASMKHTKQLLVALNAEGFVSRQEAVSMIPPIMLDVQAGHRVIDMCAAPGSKTTQILERLAAQGPGGIVVANDLNQGRLDVLTHQTARLPDAKSRLVITNHDATCFPFVSASEHKFDRVLCDVMCSGDGTLRKSVDLWARWNPLMGPHLHEQQSRVLLRGMGLCKEGGIVVYSTCSLNPVEDEAVIARCLQEAGGSFELIDPTTMMSNFEYYPGKHSWSLLSPDGETELTGTGESGTLTLEKHPQPKPDVAADEDAAPADGQKRRGGKSKFSFTKSMFAPEAAIASSLHLERCVRVAPHLQDTGGFFIAALRCVRELPNSVSNRAKYSSCIFAPLSAENLAELRKGVTLPDDFPFHRLFSNPEAQRLPKIYYLAEDCAAAVANINANIVQVGVKVFESQSKFLISHSRVVSDGAATIAPLLGDLLLRTTAARFVGALDTHRTDVASKSVCVDEVTLRADVVDWCPEGLPTSGVVAVECGEALGRLCLPFDTHRGGITIHFSPSQIALLNVAVGRKLSAGDEAASDADDDGEAQAKPPQPPADE